MQRTVIIFGRPPRYGVGKTRLARDIGRLESQCFYRSTLSSVQRKLSQSQRFKAYLSLTPDRAVDDGPGPVCEDLPLIKQGRGDLGARMARALTSGPPGPVLIIGSDIPDVSPALIERAFKALGSADAVFGPCDDGGYWLIGLKRLSAPPPGFLKGVRWSSQFALSDTCDTLPKRWKIAYINTLDDIDDGEAFRRWRLKKNS